MLMAQLASMTRTLSMAGSGGHKPETKKRAAQGTVEFQNFMAAADRVDKAARDFLEHRISLRAASKTDTLSPC
ncbi:hypothetical protein ACQJBY_000517 [Aegilops geniculata]